jgi:hypothetical protein
VAHSITTYHTTWLKTPGRKGQPHQDTNMRTFRDPDGQWLNRWDVLKET